MITPFEEVPTSKKIPASSKILEMLGKSDIVKERYTSSIQPYSGSNAGIGVGRTQKIQFKLFNNADYCDLTSAYITFNAVFGNGTGSLSRLNFSDNALSWFPLVRTLINDQIVEEISNFNIYVNLLTYASTPKAYYESQGSFSGCYLHSTCLVGAPRQVWTTSTTGGNWTQVLYSNVTNGNTTPWEQISSGAPSWLGNYAANNSSPTTGGGGNDDFVNDLILNSAGTYFTLPLAGYLGVCSIDKLFPLRNVSSITIELNLPTSPLGVLFYNYAPATGTATTNITGTTLDLTNMYLHYDCVVMADAYLELMNQELNDPNGLGTQFVVNTVESVAGQLPASAGASSFSKKTLVVSKGTRYLKSFWACQMPNFAYQGGLVAPSSGFPKSNFQSCNLVVNSKRFPQFQIDNTARAYSEMAKSFGKFNNIIGDSIITINKYNLDLSGNTTDYNTQPDLKYASFILGFNLEQILDAPEVQLGGLNTITAGFQMQLELTSANIAATTIFMFPHFSKIVRIKGGSVAVIN
jgi:hypothetical protein